MGDSKYYIPSIEEFHVGFEFERTRSAVAISEDDWYKDTIEDQRDIAEVGKYEELRVKRLDREDIESFGIEDIKFEYDNNAEPIPSRKDSRELPTAYLLDDQFVTGQAWYLYHYEKDNVIWIEYIKDCGGQGFLFKGNCKNKSQLKHILQWIEILK